MLCEMLSSLCLYCLMQVNMGGVACNGWSTLFVLSDACKNGMW